MLLVTHANPAENFVKIGPLFFELFCWQTNRQRHDHNLLGQRLIAAVSKQRIPGTLIHNSANYWRISKTFTSRLSSKYVRKWYYTINACCTILWNRKRSTEQTCVFSFKYIVQVSEMSQIITHNAKSIPIERIYIFRCVHHCYACRWEHLMKTAWSTG